MLILLSLLMSSSAVAHESGAYAWETSVGISNKDWMEDLPDSRRLSHLSIIMTHDTMTYDLSSSADSAITQRMSLQTQLDSGVRGIDIRVKWNIISQEFDCYHGLNYLGMQIDDVLDTVEDFLDEHPTEAIVMNLENEWGDDDDNTFASEMEDVYAGYPGLFWSEDGVTNPTMDAMRGKVVTIVSFNIYSYDIPSIDWDDIDYYGDWSFLQNIWGQSDKWDGVKEHLDDTETGSSNTIFYTGLNAAFVGSKPWFYASGHTTSATDGSRDKVGIWIEDWQYEDFHRDNCFTNWLGTHVCDVWLDGQNDLAYEHIDDDGIERMGILGVDFPGADLIEQSIDLSLDYDVDEQIVAKWNSGVCLNVIGNNSTSNGASVNSYDCDSVSETWEYDVVDHKIHAAWAPHMCLNVIGNKSTANGQNVNLYKCSSVTETWEYSASDHKIHARWAPHMCLNIVGNQSTTNGQNVNLYQCSSVTETWTWLE